MLSQLLLELSPRLHAYGWLEQSGLVVTQLARTGRSPTYATSRAHRAASLGSVIGDMGFHLEGGREEKLSNVCAFDELGKGKQRKIKIRTANEDSKHGWMEGGTD